MELYSKMQLLKSLFSSTTYFLVSWKILGLSSAILHSLEWRRGQQVDFIYSACTQRQKAISKKKNDYTETYHATALPFHEHKAGFNNMREANVAQDLNASSLK